MTFSILGYDEAEQTTGAAIQSKFPGVASLCLHARAGAGAVVSQAFSNPDHGSKGLTLLELGVAPNVVIETLVRGDENAKQRQIAVASSQGAFAKYVGADIANWNGYSGGVLGKNCVAIGNSLASERVLKDMTRAFDAAKGDDLAMRLIKALAAGQAAGGEIRGMQAAGVLVVKEGGGYLGKDGRHVDISVYDHAEPIAELARCYQLHGLSYFPSKEEDLSPIDEALDAELTALLVKEGYLDGAPGQGWSEAKIAAMARFMGVENYDNRIRNDNLIDREVLADIRSKKTAV